MDKQVGQVVRKQTGRASRSPAAMARDCCDVPQRVTYNRYNF